MNLKKIVIPKRYNYIGCFLTLNCNLRCNYCINSFGNSHNFSKAVISGKDWIKAINRIVSREDLPVTLQGGEPSLHPDFIWIINNISRELNIDILTNLCFDIDEFIKEVNPDRIRRNSPYPSIRVSYHPSHMELDVLTDKVLKMQAAGFSIGVYGVLYPEIKEEILKDQRKCLKLGIDFRTKEFLGRYKGKIYGTYLYPKALGGVAKTRCLCRTSELIVGPEAGVFKCHHDLYKNFSPIGNLLDQGFEIEDIFRECNNFGNCNPCDIKIKTNRFQIFGHTSVEIKNG